MKRPLVALCAALALAAGAASSTAAPHAAGRFVVVFAQPRNADERFLIELLKAAQLSTVFGELSKALILPRTITIRVQGGSAGPYYDPRTRTVILNHDFSALVLRVFEKEYPKITPRHLGELFAELEYFVLFHEVGHALVDQWDLPVLGREEDAVDAFSTIFMTDIVDEASSRLPARTSSTTSPAPGSCPRSTSPTNTRSTSSARTRSRAGSTAATRTGTGTSSRCCLRSGASAARTSTAS